MKKGGSASGAEGNDAEAASEAVTAKHSNVIVLSVCVRHIFNNMYCIFHGLEFNRLKF